MGASIFNRNSSNALENNNPIPANNPNPSNYEIIAYKNIGKALVVDIRYPDCKNYEGRKILVFEDCLMVQLIMQERIDPHFSDNKRFFSPIARFEPTLRGWNWAIEFANKL